MFALRFGISAVTTTERQSLHRVSLDVLLENQCKMNSVRAILDAGLGYTRSGIEFQGIPSVIIKKSVAEE